MTWVDLLLLLLLGWSVLSGFIAGFARVGIGTAATFIGIFAGFWCYGTAGAYVLDYVSSRPLANLIGFVLVFGGIVLIGAILGNLLARLFKWVGLSWVDRLLGGAFGAVRGIFITVALVTVLMAFAPSPPPRAIVDSQVLPYVVEASNVLSWATPHEIKESYRRTKESVQGIWQDHLNRKRP